MLLLGGPKAREVLAPLTTASLDNDAFKWMTGAEVEVAGVAVRALRVSYIGELGWELHVPIEKLRTVYDALWRAGEACSARKQRPRETTSVQCFLLSQAHGIVNFGLLALDSMRMEKEYRALGAELTNEITLLEAGMQHFFKSDKKDFIGRDATLKVQEEGLAQKLAYVEVDATDNDVRGGEPVFDDGGECVGVATSGAYGHCTRKSLAFVYVTPQHAEPGAPSTSAP
jgi:dimethylglycine dehydrogenase